MKLRGYWVELGCWSAPEVSRSAPALAKPAPRREFPTPPLPPRNLAHGHVRPPEGTPPVPLIDLSKFEFSTVKRPDGRLVRIERWGEICIPDVLGPGGAELPPLVVADRQLRLQCFGDTGKGTPAQFEVARSIEALGDQRKVHANIHCGDIIYPNGILGPNDSKVQDLFIKPYGRLKELHITWGNHEYGDHRAAGVPEAWLEVARAGRPDAPKMPQRYYTRRFICDGMTVRALFLDTSTIAVDPVQLAWVAAELEKQDCDYTLVFGHHTIYSAGLHGVVEHMEKLLLPLLEKHADMYVCGHDHNLQFLRGESGFPFVVSGSAGESRVSWRTPKSEYYSGRMGTSFLTIGREGIGLEIVDGKTRETLFTRNIPKRRRGST